MAQEIITLEDLKKFRLQLLEDLKVLLQQPNLPKTMVEKFRSKKDAWHPDSSRDSWHITTKPPY